MRYRVRVETTFEAAHKLFTSANEACVENIHGHSYRVEWFLSTTHLDENRVVVDFGVAKRLCRELTEVFDHSLILHPQAERENV